MTNIYHAYPTPIEDKFVIIDTSDFSSKTYLKVELQNEKDELLLQISMIPDEVTDDVLLAWAKENYPHTDYSYQRTSLVEKLDTINNLLEAINKPLTIN